MVDRNLVQAYSPWRLPVGDALPRSGFSPQPDRAFRSFPVRNLIGVFVRGPRLRAFAPSMVLPIVLVVGALFGGRTTAYGGVVSFTDVDAFRAAADGVQEIDFNTLPDGTPGFVGAQITPEFNYGTQGVEFFGQANNPILTGRLGGFTLCACPGIDKSIPNWIIADFVEPVFAVGAELISINILSAFDINGNLIAEETFVSTDGAFGGFVSDVPIASVIMDRGIEVHSIDGFFFAPVPEPSTAFLLSSGAVMLLRRRRRIPTRS